MAGDTADVDERVTAEWVEDTTPFERVHSVLKQTYDPQSADRIADRAQVSPTTARKHLRTLGETGAVATEQDGQTTLYRRSETDIVTEHAQELLEARSTDELAAGITEMKATLRAFRSEYGVDSPEAFAREMTVEDADDDRAAVLREWQTTRRNLTLAQAALAIGEATAAVGDVDRDTAADV